MVKMEPAGILTSIIIWVDLPQIHPLPSGVHLVICFHKRGDEEGTLSDLLLQGCNIIKKMALGEMPILVLIKEDLFPNFPIIRALQPGYGAMKGLVDTLLDENHHNRVSILTKCGTHRVEVHLSPGSMNQIKWHHMKLQNLTIFKWVKI